MWLFRLDGPWMDIGLDSSVVEHLTSNAGVPCSISGPSVGLYFHLYFFAYVHAFLSSLLHLVPRSAPGTGK